MEPTTIRRLDLWAGKPICAVLTFCRMLLRIFGKGKYSGGPATKVLFIKLIEQGSTVLAHPALCRAIDMVGRENVYFLVFEANREILDLLDVIPSGNVLVLRSGNLFGFVMDVLNSLRRTRREGIDAVIDMEFFARSSAILAFLSGARMRVGLHRFTSEGPYRGDLLTHRVQYNPYVHAAESFYSMVDSLNECPAQVPMPKRELFQKKFAPPRFEPTEGDIRQVRSLLNHLGGREITRPVVLLNPNASDMLPLRKWPTQRFVDLGRLILSGRNDVTVVITGAPSEQNAARDIASAIGSRRAISMAGRTSLRELLTLFCLADILVTNDSGPSHFASMTPIHAVSLFGPETPLLYGPLGDRTRIIWSGLGCSPCVNVFNHRFSPCTDNLCMKSITVSRVYEEVRKILEKDPRTSNS